MKLPLRLGKKDVVAITPKHPKLPSWIKLQVLPVDNDGCITVVNETMLPVELSKLEHFADVISCIYVPVDCIKSGENVHKIYDLGQEDLSHLLTPLKNQSETQQKIVNYNTLQAVLNYFSN